MKISEQKRLENTRNLIKAKMESVKNDPKATDKCKKLIEALK